MPHVKSPEERGAIGAWAYETRDRLGLSVEQVIERLPTRYHPATLRKVEGGSAAPGRRMLRELADFYLAEGERRSTAVLAPPGQSETAAPEGTAVAAAIDRQTTALNALVDELRRGREDHEARLRALEAAVALLAPGGAVAPQGQSVPRA